MKPIAGTKSNNCDHCESFKTKNIAGDEVTRYKCDFQLTENPAYSKPCTMYDWAKCTFNEDK